MYRSRNLWLLAGTLLAVGSPAVDAKKPRKSACQRLQAEHTDRSAHRKLVLVVRGHYDAGDISACVLPRGKVRRLARWDDGLGRAGADLVATKGYFALVLESWGDQYGGVSQVLRHVDARTRKGVTLAGYGCMLHYSQQTCPDGTSYGKRVLARTGAGAIELTDLATGSTSLRSFDPAGDLARLDEGPVDDLRLASGEIVWVRAGLERRAPLPD